MMDFKVTYHNVDLKVIQKKLSDSKKKANEINSILLNLSSLMISSNTADLKDIKNIAKMLTEKKDIIVVFGIGGSNLGAMALINILQCKFDKRIIFFDNIDPIHFSNSILELNLNRTGFIIISKSGSTPEILSQFSSIIEIIELQDKSDELLKSCVVITENKDSPLKRIANNV